MEFNPSFTKNELYQFLMQKGVEEDDAKKIQEEKVDGETFQDITDIDLKEIGVKLGTRKKILKIIQNFKQSFLQNAELQDVKILGTDSNLSNNLVFDLITTGSPCTVMPTVSATVSSTTTSSGSSTTVLLPSSPKTAEETPPVVRKSLRTVFKKRCAPQSSYLSEILPTNMKNSTVADLCTEDATEHALTMYADPKNINVMASLNKHTTGKKIISNLKTGKGISRNDISEIVRIVVHAMIEDLRTLYPSSAQKHNLAQAIVRDIPELKSNREGIAGYEQFYDPNHNSGSIEWRLKTLRVRVPASKKRRRTRKSSEPKQTSQDEEEEFIIDNETLQKVNWLKSQPAVDDNKKKILEAMADTFDVRRNYILKRSPSISDILEVFPKLKEFSGALIHADFELIHTNAGNLLEEFPAYSEKIRTYVIQQRRDIADRIRHVKDENLKAMMYLADLLPISGVKRNKSEDEKQCYPSETLVTFTGEDSCVSEEDLAKHPRLLCCGQVQDEQLQFFLVLNKEYVDLGKCFLKAFDILYKSYKVFNAEYPKLLSIFYNFMDTIIYKVNTGVGRSSVEHLNNILCCINTNL